MEEISIKNRLELMNVLPSEACGEVFTRADVANNVLKLLKTKPGVFSNPNYRFLDIYTKSGVFLLLIYSELMQGLVEAIPDPEIRSQHILGKMIYGVSPSVETALISRKTLYGDWSTQGNIKAIAGYKNDTGKRTFSNISKEFNGMKFDVVIGNPPYNNDMYLDFVTLAHQLSSKYTCMITPAKWQAKGGEKNEAFRKNIAPHMSDIVFHPDASNVFDIDMSGGITYYLIEKNKTGGTRISCRGRSEILTNWAPEMGTDLDYIDIVEKIIMHRDLSGELDFRSITNAQDRRFIPVKSYFTSRNFGDVSEDTSSKYFMWSSARCIRVPEYIFKNTVDMDKFKVYCNHNINNKPHPHILEPNVAAVRESCLMGFGSRVECESIASYYSCRLIWYLAYGMKLGNICTEAFKWVPDPGKFDHIFTDKELYDKYNLTPEEIAIIESVIKERKQGDK